MGSWYNYETLDNFCGEPNLEGMEQRPAEYDLTARCRDLPELVSEAADGTVSLSFPDGSIDRVVAAVAARRAPGAILQEKVDGCWCSMRLGADARVESVTSRAGLHLRVAVGWIGEQFARQLAGLTLIGEVEAGTHWASLHRDEDLLPRLHLYGALDRSGRALGHDRVRKLGAWIRHPRVQLVREAAWNEDWASFTRSVLDDGGEGVVIRDESGIWRAKPRQTVDRFVSKVFYAEDRHGQRRLYATLSISVNGRFRRTQDVLVPEGLKPSELRRRVVVVVGASVDPRTGVVRHARIVDTREDKPADECVAGTSSADCDRMCQDDTNSDEGSSPATARGVAADRGGVVEEGDRQEAGDLSGDGVAGRGEGGQVEPATGDEPEGASGGPGLEARGDQGRMVDRGREEPAEADRGGLGLDAARRDRGHRHPARPRVPRAALGGCGAPG